MEKDICKCSRCRRTFSLSERAEDYPRIPMSNLMCQLCIEECCDICEACAQYYISDSPSVVEDLNICDYCYKNNTIVCSSCGKQAINQRLSPKREIEGLCSDCETFELYRQYVFRTIENIKHPYSIPFSILKETPTTPIMTEVRRGKSDSLFISFAGYSYEGLYHNSLVIVYGLPLRHPTISGERTMTELKKTSSFFWNKIGEQASSGQRIKYSDGRTFTLWRHPYWIRAVTDDDKDFRKEYRFGELEYEGNNYGDTSSFYIVGTLSLKG